MTCWCGHDEKRHCAGGARHAFYKDEARMVKNPRVHECTTRHCEEPLCCCTNFRPREPAKNDR